MKESLSVSVCMDVRFNYSYIRRPYREAAV